MTTANEWLDWPDPSDLHSKVCRLQAEKRNLTAERDDWRARALAAEAEVARMETAACSALIHDCRSGRIGWPWFARVLFGAGVAR